MMDNPQVPKIQASRLKDALRDVFWAVGPSALIVRTQRGI